MFHVILRNWRRGLVEAKRIASCLQMSRVFSKSKQLGPLVVHLVAICDPPNIHLQALTLKTTTRKGLMDEYD